jgi:diaminopimelate decarboxylase
MLNLVCNKEKLFTLLRSTESPVKTPCYIFDPDVAIANYHDLKSLIGTPLVVSMKACGCEELLNRFGNAIEDGIELASYGELRTASLYLGNCDKYFNNPSADTETLKAAIAARAYIIVDSLEQLTELCSLNISRLKGVYLRLNAAALISSITTPKNMPMDHMGMDASALFEAIPFLVERDIPLIGLHVFSGSYSFGTHSLQLLSAMDILVTELRSTFDFMPSVINMGGGFTPNFRELEHEFVAYKRAIDQLDWRENIIHESGRAIFSSAGIFVTRVSYCKTISKQRFVVCDGGMAQNFLLAKTESALKKYESPLVFSLDDEAIAAFKEYDYKKDNPIKVVGSSCNKQDVIGLIHSPEAKVTAGNFLLFDNCGSYNNSYTATDFLMLGKATSYLI